MNAALTDNPTRRRILLALKKKGDMSVEALSEEVNVTPMGVRQHLLILEKNGAVEYFTKRQGVGRPGFLYKLTEKADDLFPKSYREFAVGILEDIESKDGRERIDEIFRRRRARLVSDMSRQLPGKENIAARLRALTELLQREGFIAEIEESGREFRLKQFNCPISKIAYRFREACKHDLQLLRDILGEPVTRQKCLAEGDRACVYVIPKKT